MKERNITLDYFKLFLSVLVVTIHLEITMTDYQFFSGGFLFSINRIAVPCFFILNGFFLAKKIKNKPYVVKYIIRISIIFLVWSLFYLYILKAMNTSILGNIYQSLFLFIFGIAHLWYISAFIQAILIFYFIQKIFKEKYSLLLIMAVLLLVIGYCIQIFLINGGIFSLPNSIGPFYLYLYRNTFFVGLPFLIFGYYIYTIQDKIKNYSKNKNIEIKIAFIISLFLFLLEIYFTQLNELGLSKDIYLSSIIFCPLLVIVLLKYSKQIKTDDFISKLSEGIYLIHPFVLLLLDSLLSTFNQNRLIILPLILILSALFSTLIIILNKRIKIFL